MAMDSTESGRAEQMRELARQYCDGAFNKGEYRRRRRSILQQWVENDLEPLVTSEMAEPLPAATAARPRDWLVILMVTATLMVAAMMGFVVYTLR